jgi:putative spermidine/putrescine transport system substrate-binding protein
MITLPHAETISKRTQFEEESMFTRRQFVMATAAAPALFGKAAFGQATKTLQVYTNGDTNISNWWNDSIKPAFEAAHPGYTFNVTITRGVGEENGAIAARALAALQSKTDPQVDYFEEIEPASVAGSVEAGLWLEMTMANVPNLAMINPAAPETPIRLPYRGSQVLIAYDSAKMEAPKTFADVVAWAKANPGRFTYGRPDKGGSGSNFVIRAIHEGNGKDPAAFTAENFEPAKAEEMLQKGWAILKDLHPHTFGEGTYPAGNTPALQLLAQGVVDMIPAWSDQALQAMNQGVLSETIKVAQLQDLALCGGFAYSAIPSNATDLEGALMLANFMLSPEIQTSCVREIGGFPGIGWENLPPELKAEYIDVIPVSIPTFPSGDWQTAKNDGWYKNVATNLVRD